MNIRNIITFVILMTSIVVSACGPSPAELAATATQAAADIFATLTAEAPTATSTSTPSPTATATPTATLTPTPTITPTTTPTSAPGLSSVALNLDDLPVGFFEMPQEFFNDAMEDMPPGTYIFEFRDQENLQMIFGFLFPVTERDEQAAYDVMMPQIIEVFPVVLGASPEFQTLTGLDEIGDSRAGVTSTGPFLALTMRWDTVGFRRGEVVTILIVGYPEGDQPAVPIVDLASLLDDRMKNSLESDLG